MPKLNFSIDDKAAFEAYLLAKFNSQTASLAQDRAMYESAKDTCLEFTFAARVKNRQENLDQIAFMHDSLAATNSGKDKLTRSETSLFGKIDSEENLTRVFEAAKSAVQESEEILAHSPNPGLNLALGERIDNFLNEAEAAALKYHQLQALKRA